MTVSERVAPDLVIERRLRRAGATVLAAADEVGRGALCGPVTVGMVVLKSRVHEPPDGLRDSKLLTPAARAALVRVRAVRPHVARGRSGVGRPRRQWVTPAPWSWTRSG